MKYLAIKTYDSEIHDVSLATWQFDDEVDLKSILAYLKNEEVEVKDYLITEVECVYLEYVLKHNLEVLKAENEVLEKCITQNRSEDVISFCKTNVNTVMERVGQCGLDLSLNGYSVTDEIVLQCMDYVLDYLASV